MNLYMYVCLCFVIGVLVRAVLVYVSFICVFVLVRLFVTETKILSVIRCNKRTLFTTED